MATKPLSIAEFRALGEIANVRRQVMLNSVDLARQATATTAAVGLANTLAGLGQQLVSLGVDIKDMRAGNKRLLQPDALDLTVFEDCPVLGCDLITCADTSLVANFFVADIGLPGRMDKVEQIKKTQMDPMLKIATTHIEGSRLRLEGLTSDKGTHSKKGFFAGVKRKALKRVGLA